MKARTETGCHPGRWLAIIATVISLGGCAKDYHNHPGLTTGKQLFEYHCAECHGDDGAGRLFDGLPANVLTSRSRDGIVEYIRGGGRHDSNMPVFTTMPVDEAGKIADHLIDLREISQQPGTRSPEFMIPP
ncbi:MAG: Uncharacterized protein FD165_550 [Gammaproteobacteria bacterium]|nr:MAG: Uncharacterized protein FD165_550 [Gammaproteobacteria bacterium]TND02188.1 MAG: Uncharacterized protein FD120_2352 [Gammaproteobacteria bacterium]